jgi:VPDSG-CTERM motif
LTTRKHAFYGILALVSLLGLGITQSARANLITNGGFESGDFTGWTTSGTPSVQGTFPHSGSFEADFPVSGSISQMLATTAGQSYTVDFWVAVLNGTASVNVLWGGSSVFSHVFLVGTSYTEFTFNVTASSASTLLTFAIVPASGVFLDDVSVNPASVPDAGSTLPLLSLASLGLVALRRKLRC